MPYQKPEIVLLGAATELILGAKKFGHSESTFLAQFLDSELDD